MTDKPKLGDTDFDAISEAEQITGDRRTPESDALGMFLHLANCRVKEDRLSSSGDTYWSMPYELAAMVYMSEGFTRHIEESFSGSSSEQAETFFVYANSEMGILLCGDTYRGNVNRSTLYYQAVVQQGEFLLGRGSSSPHRIDGTRGRIPDAGEYMVVGDRDCREGFRETMQQIREWSGDLLQQWRARTSWYWLGLYHHGEIPARSASDKSTRPDMEAIRKAHAEKLPESVRRAFLLDDDTDTEV